MLRCRARKPGSGARVVCLPHAGGAASFFTPWAYEIHDGVELYAAQYPGREDRIAEPCAATLPELASAVAAELIPLADKPLTLFGHSLGAIVAYETARVLEHCYGLLVARLVVSGRGAPAEPETGDAHRRDDQALVDELVRLGGTDGVLLRDERLRPVFLPAIRADFRLAETYRHDPEPLLSCPVTAVIGTEDTEVDPDRARGWAQCTTGAFDLRCLPGGHFYLVPERSAVLDLLA